MIKKVTVENFKSVVDLTMELGNFNVLIGENGAGKSNILEAIGFGAAASAEKLDFEFLGSRGIRLSNPESMFSAFANAPVKKKINITFEEKSTDTIYKYSLIHTENNKWINESKDITGPRVKNIMENLMFHDSNIRSTEFKKLSSDSNSEKIEQLSEIVGEVKKILNKIKGDEDEKIVFDAIYSQFLSRRFSNDEISNFIIYAPEQTSLRKFEDTTQIYPLGIKGEGVFQYLKNLNLSNKEHKKIWKEVKKNMLLLDWYEDFDIPKNLLKNELSLSIKDRFLREDLNFFDQRSTNEGFLFLLFYSILFCSPETPSFFAIDNIDSSLNPKLCMQLVQNLSSLAKKYNKQVIVTTHSPAVLDGLNLKDSNQRLFVVRRNDEGHTSAKRVDYKSERKMKLSEIWTNGFIGGLPENF